MPLNSSLWTNMRLILGVANTILDAEYEVEVNETLTQLVDISMDEFVRRIAWESVLVYMNATAGQLYLP